LAVRTVELLQRCTHAPEAELSRAELAAHFELDTGYIGRGYGHATPGGQRAVRFWEDHVGHPLETTYSGKSADSFLTRLRRGAGRAAGPILYWSTKSSAPLEAISPQAIDWAPRRMRDFILRGRAEASEKHTPR
jgi:hypothetical protein